MIKKEEISKLFICFLLYSFIGWFYEVFLEVVVYRWGYTDRGVLFGPYCPVYGVGAMIFILAFYHYRKESQKHPVLKMAALFFGCMFIATVIELITSYILEFFMGYWPWQTYFDYAIHFQGRIALSPSIRFGLGGILFLYVIQPFFDRVLEKFKPQTVKKCSLLLLVIFVVDCLASILAGIF